MDAAYINYRELIAQDELLLNHFLDLLSISRLSSHMQGFELLLNTFSIHFLRAFIPPAGLVFSTYTASKTTGSILLLWCKRRSRWHQRSFGCVEMVLAVCLLWQLQGTVCLTVGLGCSGGWSWGEGVYHNGVRENGSLGVVTSRSLTAAALSPNDGHAA